MDALWGFLGSLGSFFLTSFLSKLMNTAKLQVQFNAFIANRQNRADATVELKMNLDEQSADLDLKRKDLEAKAKQSIGGKDATKTKGVS